MSQPVADGDARPLPSLEDFPEVGANSLAAIGQRGWARAIDELLMALPSLVLLLVVAGDRAATAGDGSVATPLWIDVVGVGLALTYEVVALSWRGQTIGKWALGIKVARYVDGERPTVWQSALRALFPTAVALALVAAGLTSLLVVALFLTAMLDPLRRGWHDHAAGTVVVRTR